MMYQYEAVNSSGATVTGDVEAVNESALVKKLKHQNLTVTGIKLASEKAGRDSRRKATEQDVLMSLHEMTTLLESGVSIGETIDSQSHASYPADLLKSYQVMAGEIRKGASFSDALRTSALTLPEYIHQLAKAGEMTGNLASSLREAVNQFEYDQKLAREFRNALVYPSILVMSGIAAVLLIFIFVVPKFAPIIARSDNLPLLSQIILTGGIWFNEHLWLVALATGAVVAAGMAIFADATVRQRSLDLLAEMPLFGTWISETDTAKWSSIMAALLASKVELLSALQLAEQAVKSSKRKTRLSRVLVEIRAGESLANALENAQVLTSTGYNLIRAGEKTGKLPQMMRSVAKLYDESGRARMQKLLTLIEPLAILIIGVVVGTIILGVILAITSVNDIAL